MDYTFKNAVEELSELSRKGADIWHGEQLEEKTTVKGLIEVGQAEIIIQKLLKEYAPTLELTKDQKDIWDKSYSEKWAKEDFIYFIDTLDSKDKFTNLFTELLTEFRSHSRVLMTAWLHPESIKVVD